MDYVDRRDVTYEARLADLIEGVVAEVNNRGVLQRPKASLRTFRHTTQIEGRRVAAYAFTTGQKVAVAVVVAPAIVAVSVGSLGTVPLGLAIAGAVTWGVQKAFKRAFHNQDVNQVLDALHRFEQNPESGGPDLSAEAFTDTVRLGQRMLAKLVSDVEKLEKEYGKAKKQAEKGGVRWPPRDEFVKDLLAWEKDGTVAIHPLRTKSSAFGNRDSKELLLHRLRRIRAYLSWLSQLTHALSNRVLSEVEEARGLEEGVYRMVALQVHGVGNHQACSRSLCFGPGPGDVVDAPASAPAPTLQRIGEGLFGHLGSPDTWETSTHAVRLAAEGDHSQEDQAIDQLKSRVGEYLEEGVDHVAEDIADAAGETAGAAAGVFLGTVASDALSAAVDQAKRTYRTNRPLLARVRAVQHALHTQGTTQVDGEVAELARGNNLASLVRAYEKATYHYPKRIHTRAEKLKRAVENLNAVSAERPSPFPDCRGAAALMRYLVKVYHYSEKQLIHMQFVNFGLDAVSREVFGVGAGLATGPRVPFSASDLQEAKRGLKPTRTRAADPLDRQRELHAAKRKLRPTKTRVVDPLDRQRELHAAIRNLRPTETRVADSLESLRESEAQARDVERSAMELMGLTYITSAGLGQPVKGIGNPELAQPGPTLLTEREWKERSNIGAFHRRLGLTLEIDRCLTSYGEIVGPIMRRYGGAPVGNGAPGAGKRLASLLQDVDTRINNLQGRLSPALDAWFRDESHDTSRRRPAIEALKVLVEKELTWLRTYRTVVIEAQRSGAVSGATPVPDWAMTEFSIEPEPEV